MNIQLRLANLSLPLPLEVQIARAIRLPDRAEQHQQLLVAWELYCRIASASLWAVCRRLDLSSPALEEQCSGLTRPSFGHWVGVLRAARALLHRRPEPEVLAVEPLLTGLARPYSTKSGLDALASRLRQEPETKKAVRGRTSGDLLDGIVRYRNLAHHRGDVDSSRQVDENPELLNALLDLVEIAPPAGRAVVVVVSRLERDEDYRAELVLMHGAYETLEHRILSKDVWESLIRGRPYLQGERDLFVPLYPMAAAEVSGKGWQLGWLAGKVHAPTLLYQCHGRGSFQVSIEAEEYEILVGKRRKEEESTPGAMTALDPWRGLLAYEERHAPLFFGREEEAESAVSELLESNALLVVGASGSGKSSLVRAGVLPALAERAARESRNQTSVIVVPRSSPIKALAQAFQDAYESDDAAATANWSRTVVGLLPASPGAVKPDALLHLMRGLARDGRRVVLFVDQLEEVATLCPDRGERDRFLDLLCTLVEEASSGIAMVVAAVRADLLEPLLEHEGIRQALEQHQFLLGPMQPDRLERVVFGPMKNRRSGVEPGFAEVITSDVREQPGALALVSQVLTTIWDERGNYGGQLTKQGYLDAGGVFGALGRLADRAWEAAMATEVLESATVRVACLNRILLQLAVRDSKGRHARRRVTFDTLTTAVGVPSGSLRRLVEPFVAARLLVLDREGETQTIEVAHEALLEAWAHWKNLLEVSGDLVLLRQQVEVAAAAWEQSGRRRELWSDATSRLRQAEEELEAGRLDLTDGERAFIVASRRAVRRQAGLRLVLVLTAILAVATALFALDAQRRAEERRRESEWAHLVETRNSQRASLLEKAHEKLRGGQTHLARVQADRAMVLGGEVRETDRSLLGDLSTHLLPVLSWQTRILPPRSTGNGSQVATRRATAATFSPNGRRVAVAGCQSHVDGRCDGYGVTLLDGDSGSTLLSWATGGFPVRVLRFSDDGGRLLSADGEGRVALWKLLDGEAVEEAAWGVPDDPRDAAFRYDGIPVVVTAGFREEATTEFLRRAVGLQTDHAVSTWEHSPLSDSLVQGTDVSVWASLGARGSEAWTIQGSTGECIDPAGEWFFRTREGRLERIRISRTGLEVEKEALRGVSSVVESPSGSHLVVVSNAEEDSDGLDCMKLCAVDATTLTIAGCWLIPGVANEAESPSVSAVSDDGLFAAVVQDRSFHLFQLGEPEAPAVSWPAREPSSAQERSPSPFSLALLPGRLLVAYEDGALESWSIERGTGGHVSIGSGDEVEVMDLAVTGGRAFLGLAESGRWVENRIGVASYAGPFDERSEGTAFVPRPSSIVDLETGRVDPWCLGAQATASAPIGSCLAHVKDMRIVALPGSDDYHRFEEFVPHHLAVSPGCDLVAVSANQAPYAKLWMPGDERLSVLHALDEPPATLAFSPDGRRLAVGSGHRLLVYPIQDGQGGAPEIVDMVLEDGRSMGQVTSVRFDESGQLFAATWDGGVSAHEEANGWAPAVIPGPWETANAVAPLPGNHLAVSGTDRERQGSVWIVEDVGNIWARLDCYSEDCRALATDSTGRWLVAANSRQEIVWWDLEHLAALGDGIGEMDATDQLARNGCGCGSVD
jgi:WD40 repeat protein